MSGQSILIVGMILAVLAALCTFIGNKKTNRENSDKLNLLYSSQKQDLMEAYGILSKRTEDEYLVEKVPNNMTRSEAKSLIDKAVTKWENDSIVIGMNRPFLKWDTVEKRAVFHNETEGGDIFTYRNDKSDADNARVIFDVVTSDEEAGPDPPQYYIHVLLNTESSQADFMNEHTMSLWLKYCKWFNKKIGTVAIGMNWHQHIFLVVVDNWELSNIEEVAAGSGMLDAYRDSQGRAGSEDYRLIFYNKKDLKKIETRVYPISN